jgi:hypothetical protein
MSDDGPGDRLQTLAPESSTFARRTTPTLVALFISLALAGLSLYLFTRSNDFPVDYHPDENTKVEQLQSRRQMWNFHHPLLMLEAANLARQAWNVPVSDERQVAIVGRWTSALLASVGVFALAMAAFVGQRWVGLAIVGPMAALCPPLLVYAHYFKEDATLIAGLCLAVLGARLVLSARRPFAQLAATLVLALGCAAATSGKYVGAIMFVPAILTLLIAPLSRWWMLPARVVTFVAIALIMTVAINARAFEDPWTLTLRPDAIAGFHEEFDHATTDHYGLGLRTPNLFCLRVAASETMAHAWIFGAGGALIVLGSAVMRRRWPIDRFGVVILTLAASLAIALAHNVIPMSRYALPLTVLAYFTAGTIAATALNGFRPATLPLRRLRTGIIVACSLTVLVAQGSRCVAFNRQFADDSRQRVREWLAANVKPGELIVSDWYAGLTNDGDPWRFPEQSNKWLRVWTNGYAGSRGPIGRLWQDGVRYVVVCEPSYERFLFPEVRAVPGRETWLARQQAFYRGLDTSADLVWSYEPSPPSHAYVDPPIRVYRVRPTEKTSNEPRLEPTNFDRWMRRMVERKEAERGSRR